MVFRRRLQTADRVADPDLAQAPERSDLARGHRRAPNARAVVEDADGRHLAVGLLAELHAIPDSNRARVHADVRDLLSAGASFDLEDGARDRAVDVAFGRRQQLRDAGPQHIDARSGDRRAEEHRMHKRPFGLLRELVAKPAERDRRLVLDVVGEELVVALGEHGRKRRRELTVGRTPGREACGARAELARRAHRDDRGRQSVGDRLQDAFGFGAPSIDLVHEDQRRNA